MKKQLATAETKKKLTRMPPPASHKMALGDGVLPAGVPGRSGTFSVKQLLAQAGDGVLAVRPRLEGCFCSRPPVFPATLNFRLEPIQRRHVAPLNCTFLLLAPFLRLGAHCNQDETHQKDEATKLAPRAQC